MKSSLNYFILLLCWPENENEERLCAPIYFRIHLIEKLVHFAIMICSLSTRQKRINVNVRGRNRDRQADREHESDNWENKERNDGWLSHSLKMRSSETMKFFLLSSLSVSFLFSCTNAKSQLCNAIIQS